MRYRYYVSAPIIQGQKLAAGSVGRIPAAPVVALVLAALRERTCGGVDERRAQQEKMSDGDVIARDLDRVVVHAQRIDIRLTREATRESNDTELLSIPWSKPPSTRRREIILPAVERVRRAILRPIRVAEKARLLKAIATARNWLGELIDGTLTDVAFFARRAGKTKRSVRMLLSLAFLDPAIVDAAARGTLPRGYGVSRLADLPAAFADQWMALGLTRPAA